MQILMSPDYLGACVSGPLTTLILAAGEGTRMRSRTPKVLHSIAGRPLIEHAVRAAAGLDPEGLLVVTGHGKEAVTEHLDGLGEQLGRTVATAVQPAQRGTGHAVACGLDALPETLTGTVLVSYGDVPLLDTATMRALIEQHRGDGNAVTILTSVVGEPAGYGRIVRDGTGEVEAIVEQQDATGPQLAITEINSGVYVFDAAVLTDAIARLSTDNAQGELYLTDVLGIARADRRRTGALVVDDPWLAEGVNDRVQLAAVGAELNRRLVRHWQHAGVTVRDPATTWLDAGVSLAADVTIAPGVQLHGSTTVDRGAWVGPDSTLTDVEVGEDACVVRTHGSDSVIGPGASVGPFAYLRPGTRLGEGGKIGTFVETKKADIGTGSKVPHLTYVGDATIGAYSNIGASSVFVNYDGVSKQHTTIGAHARTGSDTMFVAPVTVGDGAYSGAGTVVRRDVPPGALAVSGSPQRNIDGWVARKRPGTPAAEAAERALAEQENTQADSDGDEQA